MPACRQAGSEGIFYDEKTIPAFFSFFDLCRNRRRDSVCVWIVSYRAGKNDRSIIFESTAIQRGSGGRD